MTQPTVTIEHFSDILCIWAFGGQIRLDELRRQFPDQVAFTYRFIPLFGDTARRIGEAGPSAAASPASATMSARWPKTGTM